MTYNTCVTVAGQAGRLDEALELLRRASEDSGLELDVVSYRAALGGLRREKRWEAAVKLLGDMRRRGLGPDEVSERSAPPARCNPHTDSFVEPRRWSSKEVGSRTKTNPPYCLFCWPRPAPRILTGGVGCAFGWSRVAVGGSLPPAAGPPFTC